MELGQTIDIKGVEVLTTGTFNGVPMSTRDLEDMVVAFNETGDLLPVAIQLGHDARQAFAKAVFGADWKKAAEDTQGWPALGWATSMYLNKAGDTLLADVTGVPVRLAEWIRNKRYRTRSGAFRFNRQVGGTVYRWAVDHIALLGAQTPAVPGLADLGLAATEDLQLFAFAASDTDGLLTLEDIPNAGNPEEGDRADLSAESDAAAEESALDRFMAGLNAYIDENLPPFLKNRRGAPMVRQLFAAALAKVRETARAELPPGEKAVTFSIEALRGLLNLAADADAPAVTAALATVDGPASTQIVELAGELGIKDAGQLAVALAVMLGVSTSDFDGIAAKVMELAGIDAPSGTPAPTPAPAEGTPPAPPAGANMAAAQDERFATAEAYLTLAARTEALETRARMAEASNQVEADLRQRKLAVAKPIRDILVEMAADPNQAARYTAMLGNVKGLPVGDEKGTSDAGDSNALNDYEIRFAADQGMTPEQIIAFKASQQKAAK